MRGFGEGTAAGNAIYRGRTSNPSSSTPASPMRQMDARYAETQ